MRFARSAAVIALVIVAIVGLVALLDSSLPNSTQGVTVVGDNTVRLSAGEEFVVDHTTYCGKGCTVIHVWHITYDSQETANFQEDGFLGFSGDHKVVKLCGVDCTTKVDMGLWTYIHVTQRNIDGKNVVDVKWPWGWDYRPYKS